MTDTVVGSKGSTAMQEKNSRSTTRSTRKTKSRINKPLRLVQEMQIKVPTKKLGAGIVEAFREDIRESQLCSAYFKAENKSKNLSSELFLYDGTRVKLDGGSDYYHASWVDGAFRDRQYILAQAPMKHTLVDFNRLVDQARPACIVFLQGVESDEAKLLFTTPKMEKADGWNLHTYGQKNKIKVFLFTGWVEDEKPPKGLLDVIEKFRKIVPYEIRPPVMLICKNGASRCGTFALVDREFERAKGHNRVQFIESVKTLRMQRGGVLETFEIFNVALNLILELVRRNLPALQSKYRR